MKILRNALFLALLLALPLLLGAVTVTGGVTTDGLVLTDTQTDLGTPLVELLTRRQGDENLPTTPGAWREPQVWLEAKSLRPDAAPVIAVDAPTQAGSAGSWGRPGIIIFARGGLNKNAGTPGFVYPGLQAFFQARYDPNMDAYVVGEASPSDGRSSPVRFLSKGNIVAEFINGEQIRFNVSTQFKDFNEDSLPDSQGVVTFDRRINALPTQDGESWRVEFWTGVWDSAAQTQVKKKMTLKLTSDGPDKYRMVVLGNEGQVLWEIGPDKLTTPFGPVQVGPPDSGGPGRRARSVPN